MILILTGKTHVYDMKHFALYFGLATALVASCSVQEEDFKTPQQEDVIYYASFEQPAEEGTRVYANEDLLLRWTADDRVSIFGKITYNQQYKFLGETGDNSGGFGKVDGAEYVTGNPISHTVSVYPYQASTKITEDEVLSVTLPAEQHYAENSFGLGASTMVSVSLDNVLRYKNVGGFLRISLYGEGVSVSSITLKGNNGEKLAGKATVTMPLDGTPAVALAEDAVDQISLVCDTPVALGATAEESNDFWLVVPPVTFSKGFTITVSGKGGVFEKSTEKVVTIERNKLSKMSPIEVELSQPKNVIYYTSTDGNVVTPRNDNNQFGANILSNEYVDGLGVITFDGDVTSIGDYAFLSRSSLTSITIPDSVTSIGSQAFQYCTSLTSIMLPDGVTSIGNQAFWYCTSLTSITLPDSVTSIGIIPFRECVSLMSFNGKYSSPDGLFLIDSGTIIAVALGAINGEVTIPNGVTSIGNCAFWECTSLISITIPGSVTSIGEWAFFQCGLTSITIPDSVTSIKVSAFQKCTGLTSITIPDSVTSIGNGVFWECTSLTSVTIPSSVTSLDVFAFWGCTGLTSITVKPETPPTGGYNMFFETNNAPIYVPAESVEAYKSAQYWSDYADRIQAIPSPSVPVPEAIDLGLPSGVKWASFNLGASKPEEYGDYFAWGETEPHYESIASDGTFTWKIGYEDGYAWSNYKWCEGSYNTLTKYNSSSSYVTVDNLATLDAEDDAATVNWGGTWRTPTDDEWTWLQENCTWTWTSDYNGSGVAGRIVTSKIEGYTSNSIFLPAAGRPRNPYIFNAGTYGYYWSSSIGTDNSFNARIVHFFSDYVDRKNDYRFHGLSVRPVCD